MQFRFKYAKDTAKALTTTGMQLRFLYPFQIQLSTLFFTYIGKAFILQRI